jgi:5'(3')-deoxyribonucleotidase
MPSKITIAIDVDDVLAANAEAFVEFSNKRWGTNLKVEDYDEHWAILWGVEENNHDEIEKRALEFLKHSTPIYKHFPDANESLKKLAEKHKLVIVTSRRMAQSQDTLEWIEKFYPGIFDEIHFAGIWDKIHDDRIKVTKAEFCRQVGADYLIDDQLKHCIAAADAGIKGLLFGDYSWNQADELPKDVTRVANWQEVLEYFDGRS